MNEILIVVVLPLISFGMTYGIVWFMFIRRKHNEK